MTSKEALENVKIAPSFMGGNPRYWTCLESRLPFLEDINTIKQDLDQLEELKKVMNILAKKEVNIMRFSLTLYDNNYYYNLGIKEKYQLTQEEYDLLKRYFIND